MGAGEIASDAGGARPRLRAAPRRAARSGVTRGEAEGAQLPPGAKEKARGRRAASQKDIHFTADCMVAVL